MQETGFEPVKALSHGILSPAPLTARELLLLFSKRVAMRLRSLLFYAFFRAPP